MTINEYWKDAALTLELQGRLDATTAPLLEEKLNNSAAGARSLTLDFANLEYLSSAGIRVLVIAYRIMHGKGSLRTVNAGEIVKEAIDLAGVGDIISVS